jgi:hypothetical protein
VASNEELVMNYWLQFWWMSPIALSICVTANTLGVSGAALFWPFYTLVFPLLGHHLEPVQAVEVGIMTEIFGFIVRRPLSGAPA